MATQAEVKTIYAPRSAGKIAQAAQLIIEAARLLDGCGDKYVIALVEAVEGSEFISRDLALRLLDLASKLDSD